jgi:hypothetical protein
LPSGFDFGIHSHNYNVAYSIYDELGNISSNNNHNFEINKDALVPTYLSNSLDLDNGIWTNDSTPRLNFYLDDPDQTDWTSGLSYQIQINSLDTLPSNSYTSSWQTGKGKGMQTYTTPTLADNYYYWKVWSRDYKGVSAVNQYGNNTTSVIKVDTTPPDTIINAINPIYRNSLLEITGTTNDGSLGIGTNRVIVEVKNTTTGAPKENYYLKRNWNGLVLGIKSTSFGFIKFK